VCGAGPGPGRGPSPRPRPSSPGPCHSMSTAGAPPSDLSLYRRKFKSKAKLETCLSYFSCKS
jgi:hypothetical protein